MPARHWRGTHWRNSFLFCLNCWVQVPLHDGAEKATKSRFIDARWHRDKRFIVRKLAYKQLQCGACVVVVYNMQRKLFVSYKMLTDARHYLLVTVTAALVADDAS